VCGGKEEDFRRRKRWRTMRRIPTRRTQLSYSTEKEEPDRWDSYASYYTLPSALYE